MAGTSFSAKHPTVSALYPVITDHLSTPPNLLLFAYCTGTPDTTANVYQHGCILIQTDSGTGTVAVWQNRGSYGTPEWYVLPAVSGIDALRQGSNKLEFGTINAAGTTTSAPVSFRMTNYLNTESTAAGANNALVYSLVGAGGVPVPLHTGLVIGVRTRHTLQAGANTLNLNQTGAVDLVRTDGNNFATALSAGVILQLIYANSKWYAMTSGTDV